MTKCPQCDGKGWVWVVIGPDDMDKDPCDNCDNGYIKEGDEDGSVNEDTTSIKSTKEPNK